MKNLLLIFPLLMVGFSVLAQKSQADSAVRSPIKGMTDEQYLNLKSGDEMGMARVAELNSFPSPVEVEKLGKELGLTVTQKAQLAKVVAAWRFKVKEMGAFIIAEESKLDRLFASGKATDGAVIYYSNQIGLLTGELRNAHLQAHLKAKNILTRDQVKRYNQIKGYTN